MSRPSRAPVIVDWKPDPRLTHALNDHEDVDRAVQLFQQDSEEVFNEDSSIDSVPRPSGPAES